MSIPQRLQADRAWPLYHSAATRQIEHAAQALLPPHTLMQRAGEAVFRLGRALYPHARRVCVVAGPGNNGGDGLVAARLWHALGPSTGTAVSVVWLGQPDRLPPDARWAWEAACAAGVPLLPDGPDAVAAAAAADVWVDALLGLGTGRPLQGTLAEWSDRLQTTPAPVLCVDSPSGLDNDRGHWWGAIPIEPRSSRHTLALLSLKPGLFTGAGRALCGDLWFADLGVGDLDLGEKRGEEPGGMAPSAWLHAASQRGQGWAQRLRQHHSHKGSRGSVWVLGGQQACPDRVGMTGAAVLAARAALHRGAGRVYLGLLPDEHGAQPAPAWDPGQPELMLRPPARLLEGMGQPDAVTVCGCGGGQALQPWLEPVLAQAQRLVLDADGLNLLAQQPGGLAGLRARSAAGLATVLTPHPLEAARLLGCDSPTVQQDRLAAATALAQQSGAVVVLKGSGTVVAAPGLPPRINPTGSGWLASAGTGDVLAGMVGAAWALAPDADPAQLQHLVCDTVHAHGRAADEWPADAPLLCASNLVKSAI